MRLNILSVVLMVTFGTLISPREAFAVIQNLNGQTGQNQTFQNDSNVAISSSSNVHSLGWLGLLPISRGGTGANSFTSGSLLFSNGTTISQDNSNLFWDDTNNRLGLGTAGPSGQLHLGGTGQTITNNYGLLVDDKTAGTSNFNIWSGPALTDFNSKVQSEWSGIVGKNVFTSINDPTIEGQTGWFLSQASTSDANALTGIGYVTTGGVSSFGVASFAYSIAPAGQTVPYVAASWTRSDNDGAGTVTNMQGVLLESNLNTGNGTITNNYGIQINDQTVGINNYSIYTNQSSDTNNYALYNAGQAKSYFGGDIAVAGTIKGDSTMFLGNSSTPACIEMADSDGNGVTYVTANDGVLSASTTKPSACQ